MKIFFAGSIRAGRDDQELYFSLIQELRKHGDVLNEHVADKALTSWGEVGIAEQSIFDREMGRIAEADVIVAELTTPSLGVGYEIARAELLGKKIVCLYRKAEGKRLSGMFTGNPYLKIDEYVSSDDAVRIISEYFKAIA